MQGCATAAYKLRSQHTNHDTMRGLQSCMGAVAMAAGDGYTDLEMIFALKAGFLFRASEKIKAANLDVHEFEECYELYDAILEAM